MEIINGEVYTDRGSKFFAFRARVESVAEFKRFMEHVRAQHKKASHYLYAYIINENTSGGQISLFNDCVHKEKYSNDGEPSGCGNAILGLLRHSNMENHAIIVVRYFGGVLLGSGNLIRAYAAAAKNAMKG